MCKLGACWEPLGPGTDSKKCWRIENQWDVFHNSPTAAIFPGVETTLIFKRPSPDTAAQVANNLEFSMPEGISMLEGIASIL